MAKKKVKKQKSWLRKWIERVLGLALFLFCLFLFAAVCSYHAADSGANAVNAFPIQNYLGKVGAYLADCALVGLGLAAPVFLIIPLMWGYDLVRQREFVSPYMRFFAWVVGFNTFAAFLSLLPSWMGAFEMGGFMGKFWSRHILSFVNLIYTYGYAHVWVGALLLVLSILAFDFALGITYKSWTWLGRRIALVILSVLAMGAKVCRMIWSGVRKIHVTSFKKGDEEEESSVSLVRKEKKSKKDRESKERIEPGFGDRQIAEPEESKKTQVKKKEAEVKNSSSERKFENMDDGYQRPSIDLLKRPKETGGNKVNKEELDAIARDLENVLQEFGVNGKIVKVRPGPVVTLYELEPAPGTKSARVIGLADDIARSMSVISVRIAVVPGCNTIGIELPNKNRETVWLRDLFEDPDFMNSKNELNVVLGKDIGGKDVYADLSKMPHLLVAGTTGSGKSVGVNSMILSLLFRMRPEECKLIMIDPKMLEFSMYNGIPHLLTPVITDPAKAVVGLKWAVKEMEDRYRAMAQLNVRNIAGYNQKLAELRASGKSVKRTVQTGFDSETGKPIYEEQELDLTPLPYIVIVVDEMADLMLVAGKEVEAAIQRLAQMARAAGLHLIMSTQRPSVDVITGTIKANFPTRISFQVTSKIDSRTILGEQGAEQLLGKGDMLYMPAGLRPIRIHGAFASDAEIEGVVEFIKSQKAPEYVEAVTAGELNEKDSGAVFDKGEFGGNGDDDLYAQAVAIVQQDKKASTSYIQRKLRIGYNRAASLIDRMEQEGLISAADHVGRREVL